MSTGPYWVQGSFNTLKSLFDRVGLRTNFGKTVGIPCHPFHMVGTQLEAAYKQLMSGEVLTYRARQRMWFQCSYFGVDLMEGSLAAHQQT